MNFVELSLDNYSNRGHIVRLENLPDLVAKNPGRPMWRSYFTFDQSGADFVRNHKALRTNFEGPMGLDKIRLDYEIVGDKDGGDEIVKEVRHVLRYLNQNLDVPYEWIQPWFSGRRGFHITLPNLFGIKPSPDLPYITRESIESLLSHPSLDTSMIFRAGMIRADGSFHRSAGLYKVPLLTQEVFRYDFEKITEIAKDPQITRAGFAFPPIEDFTPIWEKETKQGKARRQQYKKMSITLSPKAKFNPNRDMTCMQTIIGRDPQKGRRHDEVLRLSSWLFRKGIPHEHAETVLMNWLSASKLDRSEEEHFKGVIRGAYDRGYLYSCRDKIMAEHCDQNCIFYVDKKKTPANVESADDLARRYQMFVKTLRDSDAGFDILGAFPPAMDSYWVLPSEMMMVTGDTGMGKSIYVQNLVYRIKKPTLWLNLEMPAHLNFRRLMQTHMGMTKREVAEFAMEDPESFQAKASEVSFVQQVSVAPTLKSIENMILDHDPEIVVVDTTDSIYVPEAGANQIAQLRIVMQELRRMCERYMVTIICIHHISKQGSRETTEGIGPKKDRTRRLTLNDLSGDRSNVTKVDHVFALEGDRDLDYRTLRSLKTRDDGALTQRLRVDFERATFEGW